MSKRNLRDTNTTNWIGKHVPISVCTSSNLMEEPIFLFNSDRHHLVASFIEAVGNLASQSEAKMKHIFPDIETTIKIKLGSILEKLTQRHNRRGHARFDMSQDDCDNNFVPQLNSYRYKKVNKLIFKILWNVIALFYLCLFSTVQNTIST